ncbi:hypothetical protein PFICI_07247 [Pestalotiopsis fici W106-1]|uniref:SET domain-containing protein n=1 Tax=Pestalotiopsis fici (strain W106-1 / CGMCC3.15140) TaxID=1229662 RepID=W3X889_PESFW|nr:uncharacterized protein PFICI_07247 [Pestalotiopsis fici W106-1]ETS82245.1 hypothetical protein PFICI_07247 [Pestalotiopsis fici W106-1]
MRRGDHLAAIKAFPQWCAYNDAQLLDIVLATDSERGNHFRPTRDLGTDEGNEEPPLLLTVPKDMVLSAEAIQQYAKVDKNFRDIYDAAGHQSHRMDTLLFLLLQYIYSSPDFQGHKGGASSWTWYFDVLPSRIPVPTMWSDEQLIYLRGTSLEDAVPAKLQALGREFDLVRTETEKIPFWREFVHDKEIITAGDWIYLDALYRSRTLELPRSGESMVPILDMVNHSADANAYFDETEDGEVRLHIRRGHSIRASLPEYSLTGGGDEITIDYGQGKSAAEMLFSYGFIEPGTSAKSLMLQLEAMDDDPLAKAKLLLYHNHEGAPRLKIEDSDDGVPTWSAPFVYLMCLNEDDGIEFRVLQTVDGDRQLKLFWQDEDVTAKVADFESLIQGHELEPIFRLRATMVILSLLGAQMENLTAPIDYAMEQSDPGSFSPTASILQLRGAELDLLSRTLAVLEEQRDGLVENDRVKAYLGSMEASPNEEVPGQPTNNEDDFS